MAVLGCADLFYSWRKPASSANELSKERLIDSPRCVEDGMRRKGTAKASNHSWVD